ncbi:MATE family efflux transporter [Clostridium sp. CCUG 7971]|uniref:MATE family efflux transporter n=1 Tax=Clostridium sp. CCUG 7971 TaxID=2811414 RepID=UPI001ABB13A2|nr:MATE family efflux transporter [Clostridium sp. CCUG 7971]MBO3443545.1 MATE family efflux transporter [Clostridium sp. CCUG 7971]
MIKNTITQYRKDKEFYKHLFLITLPIVLQSLITSSLNMLDTMMIGKVGEVELASVGIANQYYFLFSLLSNGIAIGSGVLIAQLWGKKDNDSIKRVLSKSLFYALVLTIAFMALGLLMPQKIMSIFTNDSDVVKIGVQYLQIVIISYFFTTITFTFSSGLRSIGNTQLPMWASFTGLIVNGILNTILIFGLLGMPALGIRGAAIATLIARITECLIVVISVYKNIDVLKLKFSYIFSLPKSISSTLIAITIPILANEACWAFGNITYNAIYARIGTGAAASMQICSTIMNLFMIFTFGLANAAVVIIGNEIGANKEESAINASKKIASLSIRISILLAILMAITANPIVSFFNVSPEVKLSSEYILYIYAIIMLFRVYNAVMIVGILRGGGDATYGSILQGCTLWFVGIPLAYIAAFILHLPVYLVVAFTVSEEILKAILIVKRFKSFKWLRNIVNDNKIEINTVTN